MPQREKTAVSGYDTIEEKYEAVGSMKRNQ